MWRRTPRYGRLGVDFIAFLTTIAEIAAKRNEDLRSVSTTPSMRQQFIARQLRRYKRQISLVRRGTWNSKQDQKRDVRSGEMHHHLTCQPAADERRTSTTSPPRHHTSPDRLEHHSVCQNTYAH